MLWCLGTKNEISAPNLKAYLTSHPFDLKEVRPNQPRTRYVPYSASPQSSRLMATAGVINAGKRPRDEWAFAAPTDSMLQIRRRRRVAADSQSLQDHSEVDSLHGRPRRRRRKAKRRPQQQGNWQQHPPCRGTICPPQHRRTVATVPGCPSLKGSKIWIAPPAILES